MTRGLLVGAALIVGLIDVFVVAKLVINGPPVELIDSGGVLTGRTVPLSSLDWILIALWGLVHGGVVYGFVRMRRLRR